MANLDYATPVETLAGQSTTLAPHAGKVLLIVNTASKCGFTPQYAGLEALYRQFKERGLVVLGFPCDQFGHQEPGTEDEIASFCQANFGVTFPMHAKIEVNGDNRHALYQQLTTVADAEGHSGDIRWNFEKFLVGRDGEVIERFSPMVEPEKDEIVGAIEKALAG